MPRPRSPLNSLAAILEGSQSLVALFDAERRLVFANGLLATWLNTPLDSLWGCRARFTTEVQENPLETALSRIAPPPEAFDGKSCRTTLACLTDSQPWYANYVPLPLPDGNAVLMVATSHPHALLATELGDDWHAALAAIRNRLPVNLQSEYLSGSSPAMRRLREQVQLAATSKARVNIVAPQGGGGTEIAAAIFGLSGGRHQGLVPLDCAVQDAETIQAAIRSVSQSRSGTSFPALLLRNAATLPAAAQQELLGFVQLPGFEIRLLSTSRISLARAVARGKLLPALAAQLTTLEFRAPPLAARPEDIPLLAQQFVERFNVSGKQQFRGFTPEAVESLVAYNWPENVDELRTCVAAACERAKAPWIVVTDLPERLRSNWQSLAHPARELAPIDLDTYLADVEKQRIEQAFAQAKGNKSETARLLGVSRPRLLRRMVQLGLIAKEEEAIDFQPLPNGEEAS